MALPVLLDNIEKVNPGILYIHNITLHESGRDKNKAVIHDTLIRTDEDHVADPLIYFHYNDGMLSNLMLNQVMLYEKIEPPAQGIIPAASTGFISCRDYFVNSADGNIYDYHGTRITSAASWSPQLTPAGDLLYFVNLDDNGIYSINTSVQASQVQRCRADIILAFPVIRIMNEAGNVKLVILQINNGSQNTLVKVDPSESGNPPVILTAQPGTEIQDFHIHETDIYYLDESFNLYKNNETVPFLTDKIIQFCIHEDSLYYVRHSIKTEEGGYLETMDLKLCVIRLTQ